MKQRVLDSRLFYLLVAAVCAMGFWFYVNSTTDPVQTTWYENVTVNTIGTSVLTSQGLTVGSTSTSQVRLNIEAPLSIQNELRRRRGELSVTLDVSRCTEGENQMSFTPVFPNGINTDRVTVDSRDPGSITVTVEELHTRTLDVQFQLQGKVAEGYQVGTAAISPESVTVSGPVEELGRIDSAVAILEDEDMTEQYSGDLPVTLLDAEGNPLTDLEVTLDTDTVYAVVPIVVVKEVPLTVGVQPGGGAGEENAEITITPSTIIVSGAEEVLAGLEEISLGNVDLSQVAGESTFKMPINLDATLGNISGDSSADVNVVITGLSTRTLEVDRISVVNVPEGFTAEPVTRKLTVTVRGTDEAVRKVDPSQVRVSVNLAQIKQAGLSSVEAQVYLDAPEDAGIIGNYRVSVELTEES